MDKSHERAATVGMFDGVHLGHRHLLTMLAREAAERGQTPTVFTFDRHPLELVAPDIQPDCITTPAQRSAMMLDAGARDVIIMVFNEEMRSMTARDFLLMLRKDYNVDTLLLGFNHRFGYDRRLGTTDYVALGKETGIEVIVADEYIDGDTHVNSSCVRQALSQGDIAAATKMLGHPFAVRGKVVRGNGIGHTIGFPTANVEPMLRRQLLPAPGVYAAHVSVAPGDTYGAMVNVGTNPTVSDPSITRPRLEAHLFDFSGSLYGVPVEVEFVERVRDERKFDSLTDLQAQLRLDRDTVKQILNR